MAEDKAQHKRKPGKLSPSLLIKFEVPKKVSPDQKIVQIEKKPPPEKPTTLPPIVQIKKKPSPKKPTALPPKPTLEEKIKETPLIVQIKKKPSPEKPTALPPKPTLEEKIKETPLIVQIKKKPSPEKPTALPPKTTLEEKIKKRPLIVPIKKKPSPKKPTALPPKPTLEEKIKETPLKPTLEEKIKETPLPDNPIFHSPMVLVSTVDGKTTCEQSTLTKLREIEKSLNVVSVVGTLRTGKSYILNKLASYESAGGKRLFETGHTTDAVTKGIWVLCRPHPTQEDQVLVFLDTEGIDDPDKVDVEDDKNLFILATLLSSTLVYNTQGLFDKTAIDKFKFLTKIKASIKVNGSEEDDSILDFFFPNFVLTLRDVTLDSHTNSDDTYLENKLKLQRAKEGSDIKKDALKEYNLPRIMIRRYFKKRKCFRFRKPVKMSKLKDLMKIPEADLKQEFLITLNALRKFIFSCEPKVLKSGKAINGRMFSSLLLHYVHSIQTDESPCLTSAMTSMAAVENTHVVKKATDVYNAEMKRRLASYTPSDKGLVNYHKDSMRAALDVLKSGLIIDDEQIYEDQAMACFKGHYAKFKQNVNKELEEKCQAILNSLDRMTIKRKIKNRKYCTRTGYDEYLKDIDSLIQQFHREAGHMGSLAISALQCFLDGKADEEEVVYKMVMESEDIQEGEGPHRRKIKRLTMFREEDERVMKEEEDVEAAVSADIEMLQVNGLQNMGQQYIDMLRTKIEEVDRVKRELSGNNSYYVQLCKETKHWKDIFDKTTWNMSKNKKELKPLAEGMERTVYDKPWEDVIGPLWKKAMGESIEGDGVPTEGFVGEEEQKDQDGITVLPDRPSPERISDDPVHCDPELVGKQKKGDKCDIL